jgi:hypothetical protein
VGFAKKVHERLRREHLEIHSPGTLVPHVHLSTYTSAPAPEPSSSCMQPERAISMQPERASQYMSLSSFVSGYMCVYGVCVCVLHAKC